MAAASLTADFVSSEINSMLSNISIQHEKNEVILKMEDNLRDTSMSLHAITDKMEIDLLKSSKEIIKERADALIEHLLIVIRKNPLLISHNAIAHKEILDILLAGSKEIEAIWTNDSVGNFIYSNPPAGIINAGIREWFNESIDGNIFISSIYISAISKNPCITISLPIRDDLGETVGVLGADIKIEYT